MYFIYFLDYVIVFHYFRSYCRNGMDVSLLTDISVTIIVNVNGKKTDRMKIFEPVAEPPPNRR